MKQIKSIVFLLLIASMSIRRDVVADQATCIETTTVRWHPTVTRVVRDNRICVVLHDQGGQESWFRLSTSTARVSDGPGSWLPLDPETVWRLNKSTMHMPDGFNHGDVSLRYRVNIYNEASSVAGWTQTMVEFPGMQFVTPLGEVNRNALTWVRVWWRTVGGVRELRSGIADNVMAWHGDTKYVRYYSPRIQGQAAEQPWNNWFPYNANVGLYLRLHFPAHPFLVQPKPDQHSFSKYLLRCRILLFYPILQDANQTEARQHFEIDRETHLSHP